MNHSIAYDYDPAYAPPAPFLPIAVDGYDPAKAPVILPAFVDTGADGTLLPEDILHTVGAEYVDTVRMADVAGGIQRLDRYTVRVQIDGEIVYAVSAVATAAGSEALIGRDVLNHLVVTLNGPADMVELQHSSQVKD